MNDAYDAAPADVTVQSRLMLNHRAHRGRYTLDESRVLSWRDGEMADRLLSVCPRHRPTPLLCLDGLAQRLGVRGISIKDESARFGLNSFKALGAPFALARVLERRDALEGRQTSWRDRIRGQAASAGGRLTVCCASDGNHGRALASAARHFGLRCVVYVHEGVGGPRRDLIASLGATVVAVSGTYDDAVLAASAAAREHGWLLVPDTSEDALDPLPHDVMRGYGVIASEALAQASSNETDAPVCPWTHMFLQAGVGGLAAALAGHFADRFGADRATTVVVEPTASACVQAALVAGSPVRITGTLETRMEMLSCGQASAAALMILEHRADAGLLITDTEADDAAMNLARPAVRSVR